MTPFNSLSTSPHAHADAHADALEDVVTQLAVRVLVTVGRAHHVSPQYLAVLVTGLCHAHNPTRAYVDGCAYCARRGNVYAPKRPAPERLSGGGEQRLNGGDEQRVSGGGEQRVTKMPPRAKAPTANEDVVAEYRDALEAILHQFGNRVLDIVRDEKHINVEDIRHQLFSRHGTNGHATNDQPSGIVTSSGPAAVNAVNASVPSTAGATCAEDDDDGGANLAMA